MVSLAEEPRVLASPDHAADQPPVRGRNPVVLVNI